MRILSKYILLILSIFPVTYADTLKLETLELEVRRPHEFIEQQSAIPLKIIDKESIKSQKANQLLDILSKESSIHLVKNGNKLSPSLYGFSPEHTLMLVDGKRMAMEPMNVFELERIQLANVERIEIISGPLSTIYGADALGGVINVITKKSANQNLAALSIKNSTYDYKSGKNSINLGLSKKINKHNVFYDATYSRDDELLLNSSQSIDGYKNIFDNKLKYRYASDVFEVDVNASIINDKHRNKYYNFLNSSYVYDIDSNQRTSFDTSAKFHNGIFSHSFMVNTSTYKKSGDTYLQNNNQLLMNKRAIINLVEMQNINEYVDEKNTAGVGVYYRGEKFNGNAFNYNNHNDYYPKTYSLYLTERYALKEYLLFNLSARKDWQRFFQDKLTKQVGIVILPVEDGSFGYKVNYSEGYRSPTAKDLYVDVMVMKGNPDLKLESSKSYNLEFNYKNEYIFFKVNSFYSDVTDFIVEYYDRSINKYTYKNIPDVSIVGSDFSNTINYHTLEFTSSYVYMNAVDADKKKLPGRTEHALKLKVSNRFTDKLKVGPDLSCKKNDFVYDINNTLTNMNYCSVSIGVNYTHSRDYDFNFRINNIFDYYRYGISERPRLITLGLNLNY